MNITTQNFLGAALVALATTACAPMPVDAGEPVVNISPARHGNLAAAQEMVQQAYDKLSDAQYANHGQLAGHAARAKELLREANDEIKLAAIAANRR